MEILTLKNELENKQQQLLKKYDYLHNFKDEVNKLLNACQENPFLLCEYNGDILKTLIEEIYEKDKKNEKIKQIDMAKFIKENMEKFKGYQFSQMELVKEQQQSILNDIQNYMANFDENTSKQEILKEKIDKIIKVLANFDNQGLVNPILDLDNLNDVLEICEFDIETKCAILLEIAKKNALIFLNQKLDENVEKHQDLFFDKEPELTKQQLTLEEQIILSKIQKVLFQNQDRITNLDDKVKEYIKSITLLAKENNDWDFLKQTSATPYFQDTVFLSLMYNEVESLEQLLNEPCDQEEFLSQKKVTMDILKNLYNYFYENQQKYINKEISNEPKKIYYLSTSSLRNYLVQDMKKNILVKYYLELLDMIKEIENGHILEDTSLEIYNQKLKNVYEKHNDKIAISYLVLDSSKVLILSCYQAGKRELKSLLNRLENYSNKKKIEDLKNRDEKELERQDLLKQQIDEYLKEKGVIDERMVS